MGGGRKVAAAPLKDRMVSRWPNQGHQDTASSRMVAADHRLRPAELLAPTADDPGCTDPTADDPGCTDPTADDPGCTDPMADDPGCTDPTADDPGCTDPTADDPGCTDPTADDPLSD